MYWQNHRMFEVLIGFGQRHTNALHAVEIAAIRL
jgi:hypothetical protein